MHAIGIRKTITATSCVFYDAVVDAIGEPVDFSYVPGQMSASGDEMSMTEKVENYRMSTALQKLNIFIWDRETRIYNKYLGPQIPDWRDLMADASLHFVNSVPYVDYPRLVTQKTVPIGGISVDIPSIKSSVLPKDWSDVLDKRSYNIC
ncbi:hypothetical protein GCK72_020107 [Caenorhabditis remanei]|uniref:glucuronosyltransferase n=1 Tax=Caenorhabditis remanei TaxID=31234 RepID=A0A6A5GEM3_CAERE|nr:hypothetical protein GCK72_020107 [Caenorhabditis remanei]KAF1753550.1 hypothetical protein GCK72_020107 [Caenorhabditis remanei]